jgi:signal transduction histidine kinase
MPNQRKLAKGNGNVKITMDYRIENEELIISINDNGVGICLTICKNIMDKYAGRIWFDSVVNEGTTFYIAFPKSMISNMQSSKTPPQYLEVKRTQLGVNIVG